MIIQSISFHSKLTFKIINTHMQTVCFRVAKSTKRCMSNLFPDIVGWINFIYVCVRVRVERETGRQTER